MTNDREWTVAVYQDGRGRSPVIDFLRSLDEQTQKRIEQSIEQLRLRNVLAGEPLVRHLESNLWELRQSSSTNIYRVIYFFFSGRKIVLLHGFQKKTRRTPRSDIELARRRRDSYINREIGP